MKRTLGWALVCNGIAALVFAGCGMGTSDTPTPQPGEPGTQTGISLTMEVGHVDEVKGMRFHIDSCEGEEISTEDMALSELEWGDFGDVDFDGQGTVRFADYFAVVEAGCYDVEIQPLDEDGKAAEICAPASAEGVEVEAGRTTEIVMVSQCGSDENGGLDILGVLNFPPTLTMLTFNPTKILGCEEVQVCVSAVDSDGDDIEFEWSQEGGPDLARDIVVTSSTVNGEGVATECVETTPGYTGAYTYEVVAYDVMENSNGSLIRVEDLAGDEHHEFKSRSSMRFPLYVSCEVSGDEGPKKYTPEHKDDPEDVDDVDEDPKKEEDHDEVEEDPKKEEEYEEEVKEIDDIEDIAKDLPEDVLDEIEEDGKVLPAGFLDELRDDFDKGLEGIKNCTETIEYWAVADDWPTDEYTLVHGETWKDIVDYEADKKRTWSQLAGQYVVALLNLKSGADVTKGVLLVLAEARELLEEDELHGVDRVRARDLKAILYSYNIGVIGPGACE